MAPEDQEKIAFYIPVETFCYRVMPFRLNNAGVTYQRSMQDIFADMLHHEIEDYVDDIIVKAKTKKDHLSILLKVLQRCTS